MGPMSRHHSIQVKIAGSQSCNIYYRHKEKFNIDFKIRTHTGTNKKRAMVNSKNNLMAEHISIISDIFGHEKGR